MTSHRLHKLTDEEAKALQKCVRIVEAFREVDHKIPSAYMSAFLAVATAPGKGPTAYAQTMGTIQPVASRLLLEIGPKSRVKEKALDLVDRDVSPHSLRDQEYFLTPRGRELMNKLVSIVAG